MRVIQCCSSSSAVYVVPEQLQFNRTVQGNNATSSSRRQQLFDSNLLLMALSLPYTLRESKSLEGIPDLSTTEECSTIRSTRYVYRLGQAAAAVCDTTVQTIVRGHRAHYTLHAPRYCCCRQLQRQQKTLLVARFPQPAERPSSVGARFVFALS